jgi:class 3 adenylate cyclase
MDPVDLREVISAYQTCAVETVRRFDGFVAKYMGDGVRIYFGYPQAHEDDAERAVRAGLELIGALDALGVRVSLQTRVGIATGLVVVGDLIGQGAAQEQAVVGETPNLAARLQSLATPNSIVIGPATRRILGDLFEYQDLGRIEVKGFDTPVQAYQVLRPSSVESRFEALRTTTTPLVGRGSVSPASLAGSREDLKDLGMVAVGDPRRLLNAIAGLGSAAASSGRGFSVGESG